MKVSRLAITLFGAALLCSASVFAGEANKGMLRLDDKVSVDGTPLNPGNYKVEWDGNGPEVQVTLRQGKETVATFPAHLTEQSFANNADAYGSTAEPDGSQSITVIYFGGKHYFLKVEQKDAQQQSNSNPSK
jgi:hypothetical protein